MGVVVTNAASMSESPSNILGSYTAESKRESKIQRFRTAWGEGPSTSLSAEGTGCSSYKGQVWKDETSDVVRRDYFPCIHVALKDKDGFTTPAQSLTDIMLYPGMQKNITISSFLTACQHTLKRHI